MSVQHKNPPHGTVERYWQHNRNGDNLDNGRLDKACNDARRKYVQEAKKGTNKRKPQHTKANPAAHGTLSRYHMHRKNNEPVDDKCRQAYNAYQQRKRGSRSKTTKGGTATTAKGVTATTAKLPRFIIDLEVLASRSLLIRAASKEEALDSVRIRIFGKDQVLQSPWIRAEEPKIVRIRTETVAWEELEID